MDATATVPATAPRAALALGYAGLIPFAAGALATWVLGDE
ncbi:MAG: DUF3429 domain-containing protein, partial [Rubrivivax sp.]|nr:DUF3429 domain-containing protein [Rubrivivax sp.]